jgi:hypothetical protein
MYKIQVEGQTGIFPMRDFTKIMKSSQQQE